MLTKSWTKNADQIKKIEETLHAPIFADARWLAAHRRASYAYVTDRTGDNPWDCLPADDFPRVPLSAARQGHPGKCRNELVC